VVAWSVISTGVLVITTEAERSAIALREFYHSNKIDIEHQKVL
jgi:hypothetical protein